MIFASRCFTCGTVLFRLEGHCRDLGKRMLKSVAMVLELADAVLQIGNGCRFVAEPAGRAFHTLHDGTGWPGRSIRRAKFFGESRASPTSVLRLADPLS